MEISEPGKDDFIKVCSLIELFELDNRQLIREQFLTAYSQSELVGFGRIRQYDACSELCSLGVIEPQRLKGVGKHLVEMLIQKAMQPLYLVCIIPGFFEPLGFKVVEQYPIELKHKLDYCTTELVVEEAYVVMKYQKNCD